MCHAEPLFTHLSHRFPPYSPATLNPPSLTCHTESLILQVHTEPLPTSLPFPLGHGCCLLHPLPRFHAWQKVTHTEPLCHWSH